MHTLGLIGFVVLGILVIVAGGVWLSPWNARRLRERKGTKM